MLKVDQIFLVRGVSACRQLIHSLIAFACGVSTLCTCATAQSQSARPEPLSELRWPRSVRLATGLDHPQGVVSDGQYAYVVTGGFERGDNAVKRIALAGGKVETLAAGGAVTTGVIASDGVWVYWGGIGGGNATGTTSGTALPDRATSLRAVPTVGGNPIVLASLRARPAAIALDETFAYVTTSSRQPESGRIVRAPKRGGTATTLLSGYVGLSGLVVDATSLYFTTPEGLYRANKDGASPTLIVAGARKAIHLAGDRDHLYFYGEQSAGKWGLFKLAKAGGSPIRLASDVHSNMDFALSESAVYFFQETRSTYAGQITVYALRRVSKAGGNVETIDVGEIPSGKLSVRGDHVVFTDINSVYSITP